MKTFYEEFPLKIGIYNTKIIQIDQVYPDNPSLSKVFKITFEVINEFEYINKDGEEITNTDSTGRRLWKNINFDHPRQTYEFLKLMGVDVLSDTDELIGLTAQINLYKMHSFKSHRTFKEIHGFEDIRKDFYDVSTNDMELIMKKVEELVTKFEFDREYAILLVAYDKGYENAKDEDHGYYQ